jgi:tRNA(adenine34) deaminase
MGLLSWLRLGRVSSAKTDATHRPSANAAIPTQTDVAMMQRALELAQEAAAMGEVPVGAVVYETDTGKILSEAFNRRETDRDPAAHAEHIAIRDAARAIGDWRLNHCTVVVTLEPCPMCAGLIVNARAGRLVYGTTDPKAGAVHTLFEITTDDRLNHRVEVVGGVLGEACSDVLTAFFRQLRQK